MKKQYVGIGVLVLVMIAAGWYFVSLNEPKAVPVVTPAPVTPTTTTTEVATGTTSAPTTPEEIGLDLSKLQGKDRLYTEEEGKYENLSEEERKMVNIIYHTDCQTNTFIKCDVDLKNTEVRLVALKNGVLVMYVPIVQNYKHDNPDGTYIFYDIEKTRLLSRNSPVFIVEGNKYMIRLTYGMGGSEELELYRPGMENFISIPQTFMINHSTYAKRSYTGEISIPIDFQDEKIIVHIHTYDLIDTTNDNSPAGRRYELLSEETKTFDLSKLP
jgi:hypothetical protein